MDAPAHIDKTAIGPFDGYCDGYGRPGATGLGYVCVLKVSTGLVRKTSDTLLDGIVAYDRAEANDAYIGQINMATASSFCGLVGHLWGYDLAVAEEIHRGEERPLFTVTQYDGCDLAVYDGAPLLRAGVALFGTETRRRFPPAPGAHVLCANKSMTASRPRRGAPDRERGQGYGVWCYLAVSITRDREASAHLFLEDAGVWSRNADEGDLQDFLEEHRRTVVRSILACGEDQSVVYDRTYISYAYTLIPPGYVGTALTVAPYVVLARRAVPAAGFGALSSMSLGQWEEGLG